MPGETRPTAFPKPCFSKVTVEGDVLTGKAGEVLKDSLYASTPAALTALGAGSFIFGFHLC